MAGLDPDATSHDSSLIESLDQGQTKLTCGIGRTFEVVRSVAHYLRARFPYVRTVKVGHDEDRFFRTQAQAFPDGIPQERALGSIALLNRYGPAFVQRLMQELPLDPRHHWVLTI